jgi:phosphatidylserine/phosphatidylglycerophosphate/cardiolipin synthase-like enzyme
LKNARQSSSAAPRVYFGGGRRPAGVLRDLLLEKIEAVPSGGSIDWVTYYLRDAGLARALVAARRRGVRVTVTVEARPRTGDANREIAAFLASREGLGCGFRELSLPGLPGGLNPRLHGKLYCFSGPRPCALIGSFNPSGNPSGNSFGNLSGDFPDSGCPAGAEEKKGAELRREEAILAEIGNQDRGYNLLVELTGERLVRGLVSHARWLNRLRPVWGLRADLYLNRHLREGETEVFFWPRLRPHPVLAMLREMGPGTRVRLAASHLRGFEVVSRLLALARSGIEFEILAEATERRVPLQVEKRIRAAGIRFSRVGLDTGLPMHDKFLLAEKGSLRKVSFGSFNWTMRSRWFNYEIGVLSQNPELFETFATRWRELTLASSFVK